MNKNSNILTQIGTLELLAFLNGAYRELGSAKPYRADLLTIFVMYTRTFSILRASELPPSCVSVNQACIPLSFCQELRSKQSTFNRKCTNLPRHLFQGVSN